MSERKRGVGRIWTLIWMVFIGQLIAYVIAIVALVWGFIDVIWSIISGRDDLSETSRPAGWISATFEWMAGQFIYVFTGGGDGGWRPLPTS